MKRVQFQIVIPAHNAVDLIGRTMHSIWQQQFDRESIDTVIVDFGSTDGTYQEILSYDPYHLGVYQAGGGFADDQMAAEAGRLAGYSLLGESCRIVLWPGDIIYPHALERVAQAIGQHSCKGMIISEADIKAGDGSVVRLPALYGSERTIDGREEYMEYLIRGWRHHVMCFGGEISGGLCYVNGQMNERIWWSKSITANFGRDALYIPESLGCIQERYYEDELWEIMLRWSAIMRFTRSYEGKCGKKPQESVSIEENMARYILWRSYLLAKKGDGRQAKECFLFSTVYFPGAREMPVYRWLEQYVLDQDQSVLPHIQAHFQADERPQSIE